MTKSRQEALQDLLPPVDSPYSLDKLSAAETAALEEAFGDGFGLRVPEDKPFPLPPKIKSGLVPYSYFAPDTPKYDQEENTHEFWWTGQNDEKPSPYEWFPLRFDVPSLRLYFENQLDRFRRHVGGTVFMNEYLAPERLFTKPWYEFHAVHLFECIESARRDALNDKNSNLTPVIVGFSGELGRLVEQYYWKFRFERDAVIGVGARKGASEGGKIKARKKRAQQERWQRLASDIWKRHPKWGKRLVAENIKKQLREECTAKHIERYINKPRF